MIILFVTVAWPTPGSYNLYSDLMKEFVEHGHNVYAASIGGSDSKETTSTIEDGIKVLRVSSGKVQKTNKYVKVINSFLAGSRIRKAVKKHYSDIKFDLIIFTTPPITMILDIIRMKYAYCAPLYLLLKDIWPQDTVDIGGMRKGGAVWWIFRWLEKQTYKTADYIGCMSPAAKKYILAENKYLSAEKVEICPNSQKDRAHHIQRNKSLRAVYGIPEVALVMIYGGNIGIPQGIDFLFEIAAAIKTEKDKFLLIVGGGTEYDRLEAGLKQISAENVRLIPTVDKYEYDALVNESDVGLVLLHPHAEAPNFPSRLLSYIQIGKPVITAVDEATDIGKIVEHYKCGIKCKNGDIAGFMSAVNHFTNEGIRKVAGENARQLFLKCYTVDKGYQIIMSHFGGECVNETKSEAAFSGIYE